MLRVGFTGVPGAGKTSTARALAAFCRRNDKLKRVELVAEYARRYISKYGQIESLLDQYRIMEKQMEWEDQVPKEETDLIITDSPIYLGWLYVIDFGISKQKDVMYSNDIFKKLNKSNYPTRYDIIFHVPPKINPVKDGVRPDLHFDPVWRTDADAMIRFIFKQFKPGKFVCLEKTDLEERVNECLEYLNDYV